MSKRVDLLKGNITSSITKLALPLMGMSFLQMLYNLVDMFWIGKLGSGAVAAVGTGGLFLWLSAGIHNLAQIGGQVLVGQSLGAGEKEKAGAYTYSALFVSVVINLIIGFSCLFFTSQITSVFNLNDPKVIKDAETYIRITGGLVIFSHLGKILTSLITTTGDSKAPLRATFIGLGFNLILDPILIFGLFGMPKLGVLGAALATVIAQITVVSMLLLYTLKDKHLFCYVNLKKKPNFDYCKRIVKLSFPTTVQATAYPLISIYISRLVAGFSDDAIAVQRIGSQVESISWLTTEGFAIAVNSFIAQNFGAGNIERAKKGFFSALGLLSIIGTFATILLVGWATPIFGLFLSEPEILVMGRDYLVIIGISQLFMCVELLAISALNAFSQTKLPAVISLTFMILRIPMATYLSQTWLGLNGIWISIAVSTILKGIFLLLGVLIFFKKGKCFQEK